MSATQNPSGHLTSLGDNPQVVEYDEKESIEVDFKADWKLYLVFATLCILALAAALDGTCLGTALPTITTSIHGTTTQAIWASIAFNLSSTICQLVFVSFSSIFGRKPMMILAVLFFATGGFTGAIAGNISVLTVGRAFQGVGSGAIIVLTEVIVTDLVPMRVRGKWFGIISLAWAIGTAGGPLIGGLLAENDDWRWIFRINVLLCVVAGVMIPLLLDIRFKNPVSVRKQLKEFDWAGLVLFVSSFTALLLSITMGGVIYPWSNWRITVLLSTSLLGTILFVAYESFIPRFPFLCVVLFKNVTAAVTFLGTFLHGFILWSLLFYLPLYYQAIKGFNPTQSGLAVFPETLIIAPVSLTVGILVSKTGHFKWSIVSGWFFTTLGTGLLILLDVHTTTPTWIGINIIVGLGTGMLFSGMAFSIQAAATAFGQDSALAIAMFSFFRSLGATVGIAASGALFQAEMKRKLLSFPALAAQAMQYTNDAVELAVAIKTLPPGGEERSGITQAYSDGLKRVWLGMCIMAALGTCTCFFAKEYSLDVQHNSEQVLGNREKDKLHSSSESQEEV
ncbi:related to MFS multidrug transporter [Phialocephala subalpina]|uniref:Related to MFS multidrug transporter n=1 Tax=Phialocephala subalpina TaxID=576137 RepID=A0A1L7XHW8_9HELO|nr:related to MFS multidrug transporter [Phialocephala subalpina]